MKLSIKQSLKNLSDNNKTITYIEGQKNKNNITYQIDNEKHILKIISPNKIILNRNNDNIECTLYFEKNKKTSSLYFLKEEGYNIEIDIKTTSLEINDNIIIINYTVIDSNENYEYIIEMSEKR